MDYKKLAQSHLETALSKGIIELENGEVKELKTSEILAVAKFVFKEGWVSEDEVMTTKASNLPSEMFKFIAPHTSDCTCDVCYAKAFLAQGLPNPIRDIDLDLDQRNTEG